MDKTEKDIILEQFYSKVGHLIGKHECFLLLEKFTFNESDVFKDWTRRIVADWRLAKNG